MDIMYSLHAGRAIVQNNKFTIIRFDFVFEYPIQLVFINRWKRMQDIRVYRNFRHIFLLSYNKVVGNRRPGNQSGSAPPFIA